MTQPRIAVLGGSGTGTLTAFAASRTAQAAVNGHVAGFLNDRTAAGELIDGWPVLGPLTAWPEVDAELFVAALHNPKKMTANKAALDALSIPATRWAQIRDPAAVIAPDAELGPGCVIHAFATIMPLAALGWHVTVRSGATVSHDAHVGDFVLINHHAVVCGRTLLGAGVAIGPGAVVHDEVTIGAGACIGAGAVVDGHVPARGLVAPAKSRAVTRRRST
jgi:sugar O-acyltransferase (sialic acid O-acetyltransferase NeuD family)